jgi:hypothetical protein
MAQTCAQYAYDLTLGLVRARSQSRRAISTIGLSPVEPLKFAANFNGIFGD